MIISFIEEKALKVLDENACVAPPINIKKIAINIGIKLEEIETDEDVSGFFVIKDNKATIGYNKGETQRRKNFTIAHELGHYILHSKLAPLFIDKKEGLKFYRDSSSSSGEMQLEREANAFAAAILMPRTFLEKEITTIKNLSTEQIVSELAEKFKVSKEAMTFRLTNLGLIGFGL